MKEYGKYIIVSSIIGASIIIGAFIMKPDRSAKDECFYNYKKQEMGRGATEGTASIEAKFHCGIK